MKIVFMGTPEFAVPALKSIYNSRHEVVAVVTQPDRANARGKKIELSAVKRAAEELSLPILQFGRIRDCAEELKALHADAFVTAAYGQILSQEILDIPRFGVINIHASLLPKYRGSAPVARAIEAGEKELGVTIMRTALKVDSGDVLVSESKIFETQTAGECLAELAEIGAEIIVPALDAIEEGRAVFTPQDEENASYQPMLKKEDGLLSFDKMTEEVINFVRAMNPWPSAYFTSRFGRIKVLRAEAAEGFGKAGEVVFCDRKNGLVVATSDGAVRLSEVQGEGARKMSDADFILSKKFSKGEKIYG